MNLKSCLACLFLFGTTHNFAQTEASDSLTLVQAFVNLSITAEYIDSIGDKRLVKILSYEENELNSITDTNLVSTAKHLYNTAHAYLFFAKTALDVRTHTNADQSTLINWKNTLDTGIRFFNAASLRKHFQLYYDTSKSVETFDLFVGLNPERVGGFSGTINRFKSKLNRKFNDNIYPHFIRQYRAVTLTGEFNFDSLKYYTALFNMPLTDAILKNEWEGYVPVLSKLDKFLIRQSYDLDRELQLLSRYMQLYYLSGGKAKTGITIRNKENLYQSFEALEWDIESYLRNGEATEFFKGEISDSTLKILYKKLQQRYPYQLKQLSNPKHMALPKMVPPGNRKYFFPEPAPFPSAALYVQNFLPAQKTMKQVDQVIVNIFNSAGYNNQLHYYYVGTGFAVTTSLEKIDDNGAPVSGSKRFHVSEVGNESFSFYQVFKSIFFETKSSFRIFAFVVSPGQVSVQSKPTSISGMQDLISNSHPTLPADLENLQFTPKWLSAFVYHFVQSDIGEVPMLKTKNALPVETHLRQSKLEKLIGR